MVLEVMVLKVPRPAGVPQVSSVGLVVILLQLAGADAAKNLTVAKQTMSFKDVVEEQSMFLRRGFLVLCRAA